MAKKTPPKNRRQLDPNVLTDAQLAFIEAYTTNGCNGTRAYRDTHPKANNQTCMVEACRLLRTPKVRKEIDARREAQFERWRMHGDEAIALLSIRARANLAHAYDHKGKLLPLEEWPEELQLAVREVKDGEVKLYDGLKAAELVAVATGRLRSKVDINHQFDHLDLLAGSEKPPEPPNA